MLKLKLNKTLTIFAGAIVAISQLAYTQINEYKISATDGEIDDRFGWSASISGDYLVVGAEGDDDNNNQSGSAYVFKRNGSIWAQEAKLLPSDGSYLHRFGYSVSISGDYIVVGAFGNDDNGNRTGSAYVFKRSDTTWTQEAKLLASDGASYDDFGWSVSISGDYVIVGSVSDDVVGPNSGSVYIFKRSGTTWTQEEKLLPSDPEEQANFGGSVSISGNSAIIGAHHATVDSATWVGAAYVFTRSGTIWTQEAKLLASDGARYDEFGGSVSISGDYAIAGARADDENAIRTGSAYVFQRSGTTWTQEAKLLPSDGLHLDYFGCSVSLFGNYAVIGSYHHDDNGENSGSAYLFKRTGSVWNEESKLLALDGEIDDHFGRSVSISGNYIVAGAEYGGGQVDSMGSAYVYTNFMLPTTINVPGDYSTIQGAIDAAVDGDNVLVQPGTYHENINFNGKSILVISSDGADATIIDGNQSGSVVTFTSGEGENSRLEGFTITNGSGNNDTEGGGIYCTESSPSIVNCQIIGNSVTSSGGGIYLSASSPKIDRCIVSGNTSAASSGGLRLDNSSSPVITDCVVTGNSAQHGGGMSIYSGSSPWLINCTFSGNYASIQGGGLYVHGSGTNPIMVNSILWDDAAGTSGQEIYICCGPAMTINHTDINPSDITGSVTYLSANHNVDPQFVSPLPAGSAPITGGDYHLNIDSPVIDVGVAIYTSGSDTLVNLVPTDYNGSAPDLGAFEFIVLAPELSVSPDSLDFGDVTDGEAATEQVIISNAGNADLNVSAIVITGVDSLNFSVNTSSLILAPGDSQIVHINFMPDSAGMFSAMLGIESDGGYASIILQGLGIYPAPAIISITDVPDDQGSWVYLNWTASLFDGLGEITQYGIWTLNPENEMVSLGNVPAIQEEEYIFLAHTFGDSTEDDIYWSIFMVTAHTSDPLEYFESTIDSGYSVDNLAPAIPTGLLASVTGESTVELNWDSPVDGDFNYFRIYRRLTPDFDPTCTTPYSETIDTAFTDNEVAIGETYYYLLSAVDFNGNESEFSEAVSVPVLSTVDESGIPMEFALRQNYPNPFNPVTILSYDLPVQSLVRLTIYDVLGREMRSLVNQIQEPGIKSVIWDASNDFGKPVSAGIYLYRIEAGEFIQTNKMILLK